MKPKPRGCKDCPLFRKGVGFAAPSGKGYSGIAVMGNCPSYQDALSGSPFHFEGKAGYIYRKILRKGGIEPASMISLNAIQCHTTNFYTPEAKAAIEYCKIHRDKALKNIHTIVTLGDTPTELMTGTSGVMQKRGYEFQSIDHKFKIIPSIHPEFIDQKKATHLIPSVLWDMREAPKLDRSKTRMVAEIDPIPARFKEWVAEALKGEYVVVDIETPWSSGEAEEDLEKDPSSQIIRLSLASSLALDHALTILYAPGYMEDLDNLLASPIDKVFWNADFDVPRLEFNHHTIGGRIVDAMWLWHFLQPDMPRSLASVAPFYTDLPEWKSKNASDPEYYSACDAYATNNIYIGIRKDLERRGMGGIADKDVTDFLQVLRKLRKRGIDVDLEALERFKLYLTQEQERIQQVITSKCPESIRHYHPKQGYVRVPKSTEGMIFREFEVKGESIGRWCKPLPFSPNSSSQVIEYMRAVGHPVPYSKKEDKETTDKKFLMRYAALYPDHIYGDILYSRKIDKLKGTYAEWKIRDGKIKTKFSLNPATGRLSSIDPNVQNIPAEGELADMFRDCLVAPPGYVILRRDYTGAEALLTGYFANDELFMKLAKIGVYTFVMGKYMKLDLDPDDPELPEKLKELKKKFKSSYKKWKTLVLGVLYGLGPHQMFEQNPGVFASRQETKELKKFFFSIFPKIEKFQESSVFEAMSTAMVKNPFGYIRWLWDVPGIDGPKAIAQKPQSSLAAIVRRAMLKIDESWIGEYMIWQVHDEIVLACPEDKMEEVDEEFRKIMEAPIPELGGLILRSERKLGKTMRNGG